MTELFNVAPQQENTHTQHSTAQVSTAKNGLNSSNQSEQTKILTGGLISFKEKQFLSWKWLNHERPGMTPNRFMYNLCG